MRADFKMKLAIGVISILLLAAFVFTREQAERGRVIKLVKAEAAQGNYFAWALISRWKHHGLLSDAEEIELMRACRDYARQKTYITAEYSGWEALMGNQSAVVNRLYEAFGIKTLRMEQSRVVCGPAFKAIPVDSYASLIEAD